MIDEFQDMIYRADLMFQQPNTARVLVSWDHKYAKFALHNLTDTDATAAYFTNWELDPLFFIVSHHMIMLRDPAILERIAQGWHSIIEELSMPPCQTAITLPVPTQNGEQTP